MRRSIILILLHFLIVTLAGCGENTGSHLEKAKDLEQKLLARGAEITYADPGYLAVARELEMVPPWSSDYKSANETLQKIKDARRIKLNEDRDLGYLPSRLEGVALASLAPPETISQRAAQAAIEKSRAAEAAAQKAEEARRAASGADETASNGMAGTQEVASGSSDGNSVSEIDKPVGSGDTEKSVASTNAAKASAQDVVIAKATDSHRSVSGAPKTTAEGSESYAGSQEARGQKPVILYMTSWCGYCRKASAYLKEKGVPIIAKNIEQDRGAQQEMMQKTNGYSGIPVIDIDGIVIRGFDVGGIDAALARRAR